MWNLNNPRALYLLLIPLAGLIYFLLKRRVGQRPFLIPFSVGLGPFRNFAKKTRWIFRSFFLVLLACMVLMSYVVARPFREKSWTKKSTDGLDIVIVFDVSESMEATDLTPNRFEAAKAVVRDFINRRPYDRIGFVIFGGEAILKSPLTRDFDFLQSQIDDIRMRELKQGTAIGMGLANGITRIVRSESKNRVIILLTDGDSNVGAINPVTASHLARQEGIKIYTIGIGAADRVIVPIYAYDSQGRKTQLIAQVPSYLNPKLLESISSITGGKSYMARDNGMLTHILQEIDRLEKTKLKVELQREKEELFWIPGILATLLLFAYAVLTQTRFKKGYLRAAAA